MLDTSFLSSRLLTALPMYNPPSPCHSLTTSLSRSRIQNIAFILRWNSLPLIPLPSNISIPSFHSILLSFPLSTLRKLTCSCTHPPTQRQRSVVEYCAYDIFVLASKQWAVFFSVPILFPLQKRLQIACGPEA